MATIDRQIQSALDYIPPYPRDVWFAVTCALKHQYGEQAREIWDSWSQRNGEHYNRQENARQWNIIKPNHPRSPTLGTIIHLAKSHGWTPDPDWRPPAPPPVDHRAIERERARRYADAKDAADRAVGIAQNCTMQQHPYFLRKKLTQRVPVTPFGDAFILLRNFNTNSIQTGQLIPAAQKARKKFLKGSIVEGAVNFLGDKSKPHVLTEGYATAASVQLALDAIAPHEYCAVATFSAWNLGNIARADRKTRLIVADNDTDGILKASDSGTPYVVPDGRESKDANDLHVDYEEGLDLLISVIRPFL